MHIKTPNWVKHAVFYQIFPDRFAKSNRTQHERGIQFKPWGTPPEQQGYQGGDLYGIVEKLDYLKDLGITALYLNPIFSAASNHRYNAYDFLEVDPLLGGEPALRELLDEAHKRGMRVILDGVFNHCGRGFWAFHHILENGGDSPYIDWFTIDKFPLHAYPKDEKQRPNYWAWWGHASLPKFNTNNPGVRDYIFKVARHWLEFGIDGWRLDVPEEINDDNFWREFRQIVKAVNPEAYIVGEIWHEARRWLQGDMFDAVMNYQITAPIINFFGGSHLNQTWSHDDIKLGGTTGPQFKHSIESMFSLYDWEINHAQMNMLDSHDMPRVRWLLNDDDKAHRLSILCQMTMPGAPSVYYGDEVGLSAGTDPYCREVYPWHKPETWNTGLRDFYKTVIKLRKAHKPLHTGDFQFLHAQKRQVVYRRRLDEHEVIVAFNASRKAATIALPTQGLAHKSYSQSWPHGRERMVLVAGPELKFDMPPQSALVLTSRK
ncbi:MAG: glycoside hydrolase family 13 protein [Chloroflexota bacterium]